MKKRFWALFLAVMMVVSVLPTTAFAEDAAGSAELEPGEIRATKSLVLDEDGEPVVDEDGYYTIQLAVQGAPVKASKAVDVILCIDVSNSMTGDDGYVVAPGESCGGRIREDWEDQGEWKHGRFGWYWDSEWVQIGWECERCGETWDMNDDDPGNRHNVETDGIDRLDIAQDAAEHFATELLGTELDIRMAVVAFGGEDGGLNDDYLDWTSLTDNSSTIVSFVNALETPEETGNGMDGGTNYTSALGKAIDLFKNSTGRDKFVLFLSDGKPAYTSDQSNNTNWNGINQADDLKKDGVTIYSGGIAIDDSDSAPLKAIASTKNGNVLYQAISKDNMAADLKNLMDIVMEDAFIAAGRDAVMVDVVNTDAFDMKVDTSATLKKSGSTVTWTIGTITEEIQTVQIKVKPNGKVYGKDIATNGECVLTYIDHEDTKREIECDSPTVDIPAPVSYVIDGDGPDVDEDDLPDIKSYVEGVSVPVESNLSDVKTEDGTWEFQGWTTDDAVVADGVFTMPAAPVVFVGTWKFTPATTDPSVIEPVGAVYETEYYFEESVGGDYEIDADLTTRTPELLGKEVTGKELTDVPDGYVYDPVETGDKNKATVKLPEYIYGQDSEDPIGIKLTTVQLYYSLDANNDRIPDKYQTTVTFKVVNGSWNDETADDKTIVVTLTDEKGVWAEDGSYTLTEDDVPAVGNEPADNFKAGAWDKTPAGEEITEEITFTYTYVREIEVVQPVGAVYETEYYFEESVGGDYEIDAELTTRTPELLGKEVTGKELTDVPAGYVYDPVETGDKNKATVKLPEYIYGQDSEDPIGIKLTTVQLYYSLDANNDRIPDKYQTTVTFKVVNGSWNDETADDKTIVVTLTDEKGVWAVDGSYTLTEEDVPAVGAKPADNFKAGAWDKAPAGEVIDEETTFTYTYAREIEVVEPVAAVYKVEHYKQNADGTWPTEPTEIEFPLVGKIGDIVTATAKDYGKFYSVNEALSVLSGEVFKPFVAEGANEPSYLVLKVYYDKLEPTVSITKVADDTSVYVGEKVTYTITVKNTGNVELTGVKVTDTFVAGGKGKLTVKSGSLEIDILAVGETATIVLEYTTVSDDVKGLKNKAEVDTNEIKDVADTEEVKVTKKNDPVKPVGPSKPALNKADHYAYIVGYPDGLVHPEKNITRAEVSTIFFRMLLDESREDFWAQENWFSDVPAHMWFNNAVSTLANAGLITGYPDGSFKPNANITRAEFATIAIRFFLEEDVEITENNLSDVKGHWAEANINLAYALNLINGYPDGTFRPNQLITRAEAMTIVNRVLERAPEKDHLLDDMIEWPDNLNKDAWYYAAVQEATNSHEFYRDSKNEHEVWTELLPVRDWAALEQEWSQANSSKNPGEVVDINISTPEAGN